MKFRKTALLFGVAILHALSLSAQSTATSQGGIRTPQINTDFFVGTVNGFYPTIQSAITWVCAISSGPAANGARVIIPAGSPADGTSGFTISAVTGGCAKVAIENRRATPVGAYSWNGFTYVLQNSGGTPPVVAGSSQFANNTATAPISGGQFNEEAFNTENNGIATAQGLGITNILVPSTSSTSENLLTALTVNNSHLHDDRHVLDYYYNTTPNVVSETKWCIDNQAPSSPTVEVNNGCKSTLALFSESGMDVSGTPSLYLADNEIANFFGNGIHQGHSTNITSYTDDDMGGDYTYAHVRMAALAGASEGAVLSSKQGFEDGAAFGTVTTGGSGATTIQTSLTNGGLANSAYVIFPSENVASGTITAYTPGPGDLTLGFVTTSDTHAVSTGYGFITAACGAFTVVNNPLPATCPFTTATFAGHTGFGSFTTGLVAIADWRDPECSTATVSGGNITLNLTRQHPSGTPIYQGTGTCAKALQGRGATPIYASADGFTPNYQTMGARTSTTWDLVFPVKDAQNGQNAIPLYGPINFPITSASQTGTTVTLTSSSAAGMLHHYTAPSGASVCVSGNSNAAFNICGITNITASNGGFTLTYTVGSSASITGTGGIINVGTTAAPTINGLGNYEIDCGALVTKILGVDLNHQKGNGSVNLQANNCTMAASEAFVQPNNPAQFFQGTRVGWTASTPNPSFGGNYLEQWLMQGGAWSGGEYLKLGSDDRIGAFQKYGGMQSPRTFVDAGNEVGIGTWFNLPTAPIGIPSNGPVGGTFAHIGNFPAGGFETQYNLFFLDTNLGAMFIRPDVTSNTIFFQGNGAKTNVAIDGTVTAGGVASTQGYTGKYLHTSNLLSDAEPPLTLNEQYSEGVCRGMIMEQNGTTTVAGGQICPLHRTASGDNYDLIFNVGWNLSRALTLTLDSTNHLHAVFPGDLTVPSASVLATSTAGDVATFDNATGHLADSGIPSSHLASTATANSWSAPQTFLSPITVNSGSGSSISTQTASNTDLAGQVTLVAGAGTQALTGTYASPPIVVCTDTTAVAAVKCSASTTAITITGTGTDVINYITIGRN